MFAAARDDLSVCILRIRGVTGFQLRDVRLFLFNEIIKQTGGFADHQRQNTARFRIQRSRMANLQLQPCAAQLAANALNHIAGRHPRRLEHTQESVHSIHSSYQSFSFITPSTISTASWIGA